MFKFFKSKKKRRNINNWEISLLVKTINKLPANFAELLEQIDNGLFIAALEGYSTFDPDYVAFAFNPNLIDKYERRGDGEFRITNIAVYNKTSNERLIYTIFVSDSVVCGYSIKNSSRVEIDLEKIDTTMFRLVGVENADYAELKEILSPEDVGYLNKSDVFAVMLKGKKYYHIKELEDGDFIGMDSEKNLYKITHDPFKIDSIHKNFEQIFFVSPDL